MGKYASYEEEMLHTEPSGRRDGHFFCAGKGAEHDLDAKAWFLVRLTQVVDFLTRENVLYLTIEADVLDSTNGWPFEDGQQWIPKMSDPGKAGIRQFFGALFGEAAFETCLNKELTEAQRKEHSEKLMHGMRVVMGAQQAAANKIMGLYVEDILTAGAKKPFARMTWASEEEAKREIGVEKKRLAALASRPLKGSTTADSNEEVPFA